MSGVLGLHPHDYGWEDTEDLALKAMAEAVARLGGEMRQGCYQGNAPGRASAAAAALKRINAARRRARPPKRDTAEAAPVEYLCEPWSWTDYDNPPYETHEGINEIPIVKKTAKRIYYDATDSWDRHDGVVTLGYIGRQEFEADTRCRDTCPVDVTVTRCSRHRLSYPHCVHVHSFSGRWKAQYEAHRGDCPRQCPLDTTEMVCAEHGYTWEHCPHGQGLDSCWHGTPREWPACPTAASTTAAARSSPSARPPKSTCIAGSGNRNASARKPSPSSGASAWPWPTPTLTAAAPARDSWPPGRRTSRH